MWALSESQAKRRSVRKRSDGRSRSQPRRRRDVAGPGSRVLAPRSEALPAGVVVNWI